MNNLRNLVVSRKFPIIIVLFILIFLGFRDKDVQYILGILDNNSPGYYTVINVNDGDTIEVNMEGKKETVRFIGVDTPETHHPSKPVQCFGEAASRHLNELISDSSVRLEADAISGNRDRYNRLLRYVFLEDGTLLNLKMIEDGYGFPYILFPFEKSEEFEKAGKLARSNNIGLWGSCDIQKNGKAYESLP